MEKKQKIDEAAVWRRVNAAAEQGTRSAPTVHNELPNPISFGLLTAMTEGAVLYRSMSWLYSRTGNRMFSQLAQAQRRENTSLKSLYFFLMGNQPAIQKGQPEMRQGESQPEALRRLLTAQGQHLDTLDALGAQASGKPADTLRRLRNEAGDRWETLLAELQKHL